MEAQLSDDYRDTLDLEVNLLLEAVYQKYGYDFRNYSKAHVKRRIVHRLSSSGLKSVSELQHKVLHERSFIEMILQDLSINVTQMFRDPEFYKAVRKEVVPLLKTYPFIKIWHAGCSTGEEVYSMAILLKEEGLLDRTQIYGTDFNKRVLRASREGIYDVGHIQEFTRNYQLSGGTESFSDYYTAKYNSVIMNSSLKKNMVFADHNLVTDSVFAEVNMIVCRNVLIYFNRELQDRVLNLLTDSLVPGGVLCLGSKETLQFSKPYSRFSEVNKINKIYMKNYNA